MDIEGDIIVRDMDDADAQRFDSRLREEGSILSLYNSYLEETSCKTCDYVAAFYKGEPAGFAKLDWQSAYEDFAEEQVPEIKDLWVFEEYRSKGIAHALMVNLESKAAEKSKVCAVGVGLSEDFEAAQSLFEDLGYIPDGKGIFYIESEIMQDDLEVDDNQALMMIKSL